MNAAAFLASQGRAIPTHPFTIRILAADLVTMAEAPVLLRLVSDRARLAAEDAAAESLAKLKTPPSDNRRDAEYAYYLLVEAVRDPQSPALIFFESVDQAKLMLVDEEAIRVRAEYERYKSTTFPAKLTDEEARQIAKDAENFSVNTLLQSYGYWQILRALPSLAVICGASLSTSFSPTPSASTPPGGSLPAA
jgi:hypothetical protein